MQVLSRDSFYTSWRGEATSDIGICIPREQRKVLLIAFRAVCSVGWGNGFELNDNLVDNSVSG